MKYLQWNTGNCDLSLYLNNLVVIHNARHMRIGTFKKFESHIMHNIVYKRLNTALRNNLYRVHDTLDEISTTKL